MKKDEATALFERIYQQISGSPYCRGICLLYAQEIGFAEWSIQIRHRFEPLPYHIVNEQDWQDYKRSHAILETDEELDAYAEASRNES